MGRRGAPARRGPDRADDLSAAPLLRFLGAAGTVTGSRFLIETARARVLVDCGLFQGLKPLRLRNWAEFPVPPETIDAVVLTHAHVDHSGYLPALVRAGYRGPVFATAGTLALCRIVLPDSGHLQEEDASYANRKGFSKHSPALPLYTEADAWRALDRFVPKSFAESFDAAPGVRATFRRAGHILGAASVLLELDDAAGDASGGSTPRRVLVSGDLGRPQHPILVPPDPPAEADVVLVESTYGDRLHPAEEPDDVLADAIVRTAARGGRVVMPAFAVDRTEVILLALRRLMRAQRIPALPVFVDSPMALAALELYREAMRNGSADIRRGFDGAGDPFDTGRLTEVRSVAESKETLAQRMPCIVISASGMATGGRVLHHLAHALPDARNMVILPGFQSEGTRGRLLADGARALKMHGRYVPVRAEVLQLPGFSVHADQAELLAWLRAAPRPPDVAYVVHGEAQASAAFVARIESELGWVATAPRDGERVRLD